MRSLKVVNSFGLIIFFVGLTACGGGGGSDSSDPTTTTPTTTTPTTTTPTTPTTPSTSSRAVGGGGVKGPLANAVVTVYAFDPSQPGFKGSVIATGTTNAAAAITGLALPFPITPPYIMEFTSNAGTTDITTGLAPVIGTLRSVITQDLLNGGGQIYATPLTTMAVDIAIANSNASTTAAQFQSALTDAASQVVSTLGFGMASSIDIFDTPPLVDDSTASSAEQADVAAYRTAVEAVTAIAYQIDQQTAGGDTDSVLAELAADLADGGGIDGSAGTQINANTLQVLDQDPATLPIPNEPGGKTVGQVQEILVAETTTTGTSTSTTQLAPGGSITTSPKPAAPNPDSDGDLTLNVNDAFPNDPAEQVDTDGDGIGDNADPDDDNNGILDVDEGQTPTPVANDTDLDGLEDSLDNCPAIFNPTQTNTDGNALPDPGDACDTDDDDDGEPDATDAFPLNAGEQLDTDSDGQGNVADSDDDNDGVGDVSDTGVSPLDATTPCSLLRDCDGDGVFDGSDFNPTDAAVTSNFAPVANNDAVTVDEDAVLFSIPVTANDTDNDGNPGDTVTLDSIGSNDTAIGTAVISGNNIDYTPVADASGTDTFTYTVTDGAATATGTVIVTVDAINDAPVAVDDSAAVNEGASVNFDVRGNDSDVEGSALSVTPGTATNGTVTVETDGSLTYQHDGSETASDSFTYTVSDGTDSSNTATVTVTINPINDAPVAVDDSAAVNEGASVNFDVRGNDSDAEGSALTVTPGTATNGTVNVETDGSLTYQHDGSETASDSFTYTVSDGTDSSNTATVTVTINPINDAPVAVDDSAAVNEGASVNFDVRGNDSDAEGSALTVTPGTAPNGTVTVETDGSLTYQHDGSETTSDSFTYTVSDGTDSSNTATVTVTINPINDAPVAVDDSAAVNEGASVNFDVRGNDSDAEGSALTVTPGTAPNGTVTVETDGSLTYQHDGSETASDSFTYTVSDGTDSSNTGTVTVTINPINDAPVAVDDSRSVQPDASVTIDVLANDSDPENDPLSIASIGGTDASAVTDNGDGTVTFDATGYSDGNVATFTYTVSDTEPLTSNTGTVTVNVTANAPPVANADSAITDEDTPVTTGNLLANDNDGGDGNALSITAFDTTSANGGNISDNGNGTYDYTPAANYFGDDTFTYTISDTFSTAIGTVTITVNPINDDPVAADDTANTNEDTAVTTGNVLTNDSDTDAGDTLSVATGNPTATSGTVVNNNDGTFTYTPNANTNGPDSFTYTVTDGNGGSDVGTVDITVDPVNDDPVAVDDPAIVTRDDLVIVDVLTNDTDIENDSLTIASGDPTDAANGIATNNNDGTFDYMPNPGYVGPDSFSYTVEDGNGGSDVGTVSITVVPPGAPATVADLLAETQGGGVGAVESWDDTLPQFEYWRDIVFDATPGTLSFIDEEYDYDTQAFVDIGGFDSYWLTSTGTWELPLSIDVVTPNDDDGSMEVAVRNASDTEYVANIRIRAFTQDIDGDLISDYLDTNWAAQMLNPAASFGPGAQLVTSYTFEDLTDSYSFELEDWCESEDPARWTALNNSCNGVYINSTDSYATSLAELQVSTAWTDTQTNDDTGLDTVSMSYDDASNSELLAELVVAGNVVNFYVRDYDLTGADYIVKLAETSTWLVDSVPGVMMIRFDVPASLQSQFPDLGDEGGLYPFFAEYGGFVRGGVRNQTGNITGDDNIFNGIALDEILANFDAPAAPDLTELIGTWVADTPSFTNGDPAVFHYFASTHYEVSGTCDADASTGLEYGTMAVNATDGTFTTSTSVNGRGLCSLADVAGTGTTLTVSGDRLTLDVSGQLSTFSRLKGDLNPLLGSWVAGDITMGGDSEHVLLTFFDDATYMHSEDCSNDGVIGTEYGSYSWDEGGTNQFTSSQVYDANGGNPGCGLSENIAGDWEFEVTGDTLTVTVPLEAGVPFTRHSPTFVPVTPPTTFVEPGATTLYNVELDDDTGDWVMQDIVFDGAGGVTVDAGAPGEDIGTYELIGGILAITGSLDLVDYIMIMSNDAASGANRVCWTDPYADLVNCSQPGTAFLFDNQTDAQNFLNARIAGTAFSGSAINASTVFAAGAGISLFELDDYYDDVADDWFEAPSFFTVSANGTTATDDEYQLIDGTWELGTDSFDIALTSTGWKPDVDWRFDTSSYADPVATISNVEVSETLQSLDFSFSVMDLNTQDIYDFVDAEISVLLVNGTFGPGASVYETTITWNNDYYYINDWGSNCDDGSGGNFNGNCNVAQQRVLNRGTGEVTGFSNPTGTAFLNDNTATIELGWNGSMSLLGVFTDIVDGTGYVLEFWEVNWPVSNIATQAVSGTWETEVVGTETLVKYVVPVSLQNAYQVQGDDSPEVFLSEQNGYMRFGEKEDEAGQMATVYFFNDAALDDINNSIPGAPTLP